MAFSGAKLLLFLDDKLVVLLRDNRPDIPFPGHWDFPGGGREGNETPQDCVLRETAEETGLHLRKGDLVWSKAFLGPTDVSWLFAAHLPAALQRDLRLGDEGQALDLMPPAAYLAHGMAIPHFKERLRDYLRKGGPQENPPRESGGR